MDIISIHFCAVDAVNRKCWRRCIYDCTIGSIYSFIANLIRCLNEHDIISACRPIYFYFSTFWKFSPFCCICFTCRSNCFICLRFVSNTDNCIFCRGYSTHGISCCNFKNVSLFAYCMIKCKCIQYRSFS